MSMRFRRQRIGSPTRRRRRGHVEVGHNSRVLESWDPILRDRDGVAIRDDEGEDYGNPDFSAYGKEQEVPRRTFVGVRS